MTNKLSVSGEHNVLYPYEALWDTSVLEDSCQDVPVWEAVSDAELSQAVAACPPPVQHPGIQQRIRLVWNAHEPPRCFDSRAQWREWFALRSGVYGPCTDCTPAFRDQMGEACRCERPEVIFVRDRRSGEVAGLSGEDPRYARVLLDLTIAPGVEVIGRTVTYSESWLRLLKMVRRRAHRDVQWAIDVWQRRYRLQQKKAVRQQTVLSGEKQNG